MEKICGAGYGIAQWSYYTRKKELYSFAKSKGTSIGDEDMQIEFIIKTIQETQSDPRHDAWKSAKTPEDAATAFCSYYERGVGNQDRRKAAKAIYDKYQGMEFPTSSSSSILFAIDKVAKYLDTNNYTYLATDKGGNYTFPIQNSGLKTISCSSFVQEVLLQAGYSQFAGGEKLYAWTNSRTAVSKYKSFGVEVQLITDISQVRPGDIINYGTGAHTAFVYSVESDGVIVKGVPEVLNPNASTNGNGWQGKKRTFAFLEGKRTYALRIVNGSGSLNSKAGAGYWGTYTSSSGKTYKLYQQNYPDTTGKSGDEWRTGSSGLCLATAYAIGASGYGGTYTPDKFWDGSGAAIGHGYSYQSISKSAVTQWLKKGNPVILFGSYGRKYYDTGGTHALILLDISQDGKQVYMVNTFHGSNSSKNGGWKTLDILNFNTSYNDRPYRVIIN